MQRYVLSAALVAAFSYSAAGCGRGDAPARDAAGTTLPGAVPPAGGFDTAPAPPAAPDTAAAPAPPIGAPAGAARGTGPAAGGAAPVRPTPPPGQPAQPGQTAPPPAAAPGVSGGAQSPDASRILQEASERYAQVRSLRANFTMRTVNPLLRSTTTSRGILYQVRPDRLALRFTDPDGDIMLADGQHFWAYYPSVNAQQVLRSPAGAAGTSGVDLQAQFLGDPVRRFEHTLHGRESVGGRDAHVMTLVPRSAADFTRLRVWIDAQDRLVRRFEITETNGVERRIELDDLQINANVPADVFRFTPPPGARVIDRG